MAFVEERVRCGRRALHRMRECSNAESPIAIANSRIADDGRVSAIPMARRTGGIAWLDADGALGLVAGRAGAPTFDGA